jgi:hypothetical protein
MTPPRSCPCPTLSACSSSASARGECERASVCVRGRVHVPPVRPSASVPVCLCIRPACASGRPACHWMTVYLGRRRVPYRRRCFNGDENPIIELARGVLGFAKGLGAFVLISGVASVCYALAAGPKRTSPPPVRTTTGLPYQPGDKPTGQ